MSSVYLFSEFTSALIRNLDVYLEQGVSYREHIRAQLSLTKDRETAMNVYRSIVGIFKDSVYCEIHEDYNRLNRWEDILRRWEESKDNPSRRDALERLLITFDLNNYSPPIPKGFLF